MKVNSSFLLVAVALAIGLPARCYQFKTGRYYFDDSLLGYERPQAVVGNSTATMALDMEYDKESGFWTFAVEAEIADAEGYFFAESYLPQGEAGPLDEVAAALDEAEISHTDVERVAYPQRGKVFYPFPFTTSNPVGYSNSGYWRLLGSFSVEPSGSLPVLYINTADSVPITAKTEYLAATYYLDPMGAEGVEAIGSAEEPLALLIKGRGNATWNRYYKKPFRIKFDKKAAILGMPKSKHFVLLPHADMKQPYAFDEVGFEMARRLGMPWTPSQRPVELVLNGSYEGLYWVCEKIRVEASRVNIVEQPDEETDPELITGGWLMEIDNVSDDVQVWICETLRPYVSFWLSFDTPEVMSSEQHRWIQSYINKVNKAIYKGDYEAAEPEWEKYIDLHDAVAYFLAKEVTHDVEGFQGSFHMYKDIGAEAKLHFGPVWDFGSSFYNNSFQPSAPCLTLDYSVYNHHWIQELVKYRRFQSAVKRAWAEFYAGIEWLDPFIDRFKASIAPAMAAEIRRWDSWQALNYESALADYSALLHAKIDYLNELWAIPAIGDLNADGSIDSTDVSAILEIVLTGGDYQEAADFNDDNRIDSTDVSAILEIVLGSK